jgi:hypothetical protein
MDANSAQASHCSVLANAESLLPEEMMSIRLPLPRGPIRSGVAIDDLVVTEAEQADVSSGRPQPMQEAPPGSQASLRTAVLAGDESVGLTSHADSKSRVFKTMKW